MKLKNISNFEDFFLKIENDTTGNYICKSDVFLNRRIFKTLGADNKIQATFAILFIFGSKRRVCKIVELKDGDAFDTKKSAGEREHLETFANLFGAKIPFVCDFFICCFNQENKQVIFDGFKSQFSLDHILTGKELCDLLHINHDEILAIRKKDIEDNFDYFIEELVKIKAVREKILKII